MSQPRIACAAFCLMFAGVLYGEDRPETAEFQTASPLQPLPDAQLDQPEHHLLLDESRPVAPPTPHLLAEPTPANDGALSAPPLSVIGHLREAIRHLRAAGLNDEADRINDRFSEIQRLQLRELQKKRAQLDQLTREITLLEHELGVHTSYELTCVMGEISPRKLRDLGFQFRRLEPGENAADNSFVQTASAETFQRLLKELEQDGLVRIQARPSLVVEAGRPATVQSGGRFPVILPVSGANVGIQWREFGTKLDAMVLPLGENRVRLEVAPTSSERDFANALTINGTVVPGLTSRSLKTSVEMELGRTLIIASGDGTNSDGEQTCWFVAITPTAIPSPSPATREVTLHPIPEPPPLEPTEAPLP